MILTELLQNRLCHSTPSSTPSFPKNLPRVADSPNFTDFFLLSWLINRQYISVQFKVFVRQQVTS